MNFLPTMSNVKNAAWTILFLAVLMRVPQVRNLITG